MGKNTRRTFFILISAILFSGLTTAFVINQESRDFRLGKNLDIFFSLVRELNTFYVDDFDPEKIIRSAIDGILRALDPYTAYYAESETGELDLMTTGKYGGIGCLVRNNGDFAIVTEVYKGFPADAAGVKVGDLIVKVDGKPLKGFTVDKVSENLKGDPGTAISVTVLRNDREFEFSMKRERIVLPPVPWYGMIDSKTGYIRFTNFTQNCTDDVRKALLALKKQNPEGIILDLRSNPGGIMTEAVDVVNLFTGPGTEVVSTRGKVKQFDASYKTRSEAVDADIPLAVLINRASASASEIVAGAIQDLDRGVIVGQRSFGKGLVQITRPLSFNAQLKVTTAKYYIPSGRCIQAIDFAQRNEDGSVGYIPDSLIKTFHTRNGRPVKDGGGITPDIEIIPETLSQIATELYLRNLIFDYATIYYWSHPEVTSKDQISVTDSLYNDFTGFLEKRGFNYQTLTEKAFSEFADNAKREKYFDANRDLFSALEKEVTHNLQKDLSNFRNEISEILTDEIIRRYFYEEGAIEWSVRNDEQVKKAVEILNDKSLYRSLLSGKTSRQ
ncbi:MAG TPA: S41 family peptidase [Bacteroidales bacterium]|nr:S41 family peptidase [Bacteroidales bacterium]HRR93319.1 S41 family peptidase [Bacteroidales bacterium]HRT88539.1 S41 family peptidase [Bacteroidales bacterium]